MLSADALVLDRVAYAARRSQERARVMPIRALRRVHLGESVALEFESPTTLQYQVQEMLYVEGIADRRAAADEIATYSRLLPNRDSLTATMLVELRDPDTVRSELARLTGLQHKLRIEVGGHVVVGEEIPGPDEDGPSEQTYSVHFVRFSFGAEARTAFRDDAVQAQLRSIHPDYRHIAGIDGETRQLLIADLADRA